MVYPVQLSTVVARLNREPEYNRDPIPPGVSARPTVPGQVQTPTTQWQHRIQATPNMIPIIIDLVRGVKNLVFKDPLEVLARGTGGEHIFVTAFGDDQHPDTARDDGPADQDENGHRQREHGGGGDHEGQCRTQDDDDVENRQDQDEVRECLQKQGGLDACSLAFYAQGDIGDDEVWDNWRLEGPSFVWYFRGTPHVHVWVNVASDASVKLNA